MTVSRIVSYTVGSYTRQIFGLEAGSLMLRIVSILALALIALIPTAVSAAGATVQVLPAAGAVFTCQGGVTYTVVSGSIRIVTNEAVSPSGNDNFTSTLTPQNITAVSSQGGTFSIVGADWFGASFNAQNSNFVMTGTAHFQILGPAGPVGSVVQTFHISSNGTVTLDKGTCQPPSG